MNTKNKILIIVVCLNIIITALLCIKSNLIKQELTELDQIFINDEVEVE